MLCFCPTAGWIPALPLISSSATLNQGKSITRGAQLLSKCISELLVICLKFTHFKPVYSMADPITLVSETLIKSLYTQSCSQHRTTHAAF